MAKIFHTVGEPEERDYGYNQRHDEDHMLEKAFKEGCEHGYYKAMKELAGHHDISDRANFKESF